MRRVSYQFPKTFEGHLSVPFSFSRCLERLSALSSRQDNFRTDAGAVKRDIALFVACNRLDFEPVTAGVLSQITDEADFLMTISDTLLRSDGHKPEPAQKYFVKVLARGNSAEIYVAHATEPQAIPVQTAGEYIHQVMQ